MTNPSAGEHILLIEDDEHVLQIRPRQQALDGGDLTSKQSQRERLRVFRRERLRGICNSRRWAHRRQASRRPRARMPSYERPAPTNSSIIKRKCESLGRRSYMNSVSPAVVELWNDRSSSSNRSPTTPATTRLRTRPRWRYPHAFIRILARTLSTPAPTRGGGTITGFAATFTSPAPVRGGGTIAGFNSPARRGGGTIAGFVLAHAFVLLALADVGLQNSHSAAAKTFSSAKKSLCLHMAAGQAPSGMHCDDRTSGGLDDQLQ